jgi:hypothetical protein
MRPKYSQPLSSPVVDGRMQSSLAFWMTLAGTGCWVVCFAWMYRISERQNRLLDRLTEQGKRIERFSKVEHDLIKEVHPQVGEIKESMNAVVAAVKENTESNSPPAAKAKD